jgi:hypothetical protein
MAKRNPTNRSRTIERRLAEGRGQGRGADYRPWIEIHDLASRGQANRVKSPLHGRTCHLHSRLETDWFHAFHALRGLKDVREQYPLLELDETLALADQLGIVHPTDPKSQEACVVTTDFLLTFNDGIREFERAIAIKPAADLALERVLEKLEIERLYWSARNVDWRILTEKERPRALVKNMRWLLPHLDLPSSGEFTPELILKIRTVMEPEFAGGSRSLAAMATACDDRLGLAPGASLCVSRHLIGVGIWAVDLMVEIDPRKPIQLRANGGNHVAATQLAARNPAP